MNKQLSFELTEVKKSEYKYYLYVEGQLNRIVDQLSNMDDKSGEQAAKLNVRIDLLNAKLKSQVKIACQAWHMSTEQFINEVNEYSEYKS